jgi:hypothetical protein
VLTGTTPFSDGSDEEIVKGVANGLRPKWPSNNPSQGLVNALREQIEACWGQELKERPAASDVLQTLLALDEDRPQERQEPPKHDDTWEYVEDKPEPGTFGPRGGEGRD